MARAPAPDDPSDDPSFTRHVDDPSFTRHVAVRVPGWGPSRAPAARASDSISISPRSPALFSRRSVLGLCGIPPGDAGEAWLRMSRETPLFVIVADHIVMASAPPAAVRAELDGRQLAAGQALPLRHKSVIEVRYAEVVHAACTRWTLLFSAQYAHRRKNDHHLRVRFADGT
jgi:hypothetical protein